MVRYADRNEVTNFQLYHEDNAGTEFVVAENDGDIIGFAQFDSGRDDATIHFIEASESGQGAGTEIVEWFKSEFEELTTTNTNPHCAKFLERRGFEQHGKADRDGSTTMKWWNE